MIFKVRSITTRILYYHSGSKRYYLFRFKINRLKNIFIYRFSNVIFEGYTNRIEKHNVSKLTVIHITRLALKFIFFFFSKDPTLYYLFNRDPNSRLREHVFVCSPNNIYVRFHERFFHFFFFFRSFSVLKAEIAAKPKL